MARRLLTLFSGVAASMHRAAAAAWSWELLDADNRFLSDLLG